MKHMHLTPKQIPGASRRGILKTRKIIFWKKVPAVLGAGNLFGTSQQMRPFFLLKLSQQLFVVDIHGDFEAKADVTIFWSFPFHINSP